MTQFMGFTNNESSNVSALRSNHGTELVSVGFFNVETDQMLVISCTPNGDLFANFGRNGEPVSLHLIGSFNDDGTLDLHEPIPTEAIT